MLGTDCPASPRRAPPAARRGRRCRDRIDGRRHAPKDAARQGSAANVALTGGFHWALWVCGMIALLALPVTATLIAHESAGLSGDRRRRSVRRVTSESAATPPDGQPVMPARVQTLPLQGAANRVVRGLLRTPLLCRAVGGRLVTLYIVGRKSGRRYTVPVAYTRHDGALLIGTPFGWGRNLRTGEPVDIRLKGRRAGRCPGLHRRGWRHRALRRHGARQPRLRQVQQDRPGPGR